MNMKGPVLSSIAAITGTGMMFPEKAMELISATKEAVSGAMGTIAETAEGAMMSMDQAILGGGVAGLGGLALHKWAGWSKASSATTAATMGAFIANSPFLASMGLAGITGNLTGKLLNSLGVNNEKLPGYLAMGGSAIPPALLAAGPLITAGSAVAGATIGGVPLATLAALGLIGAGGVGLAKYAVLPGAKAIGSGISSGAKAINPFRKQSGTLAA